MQKSSRRFRIVGLSIVLIICIALTVYSFFLPKVEPLPQERVEFLSSVYTVDQIYKSMRGPQNMDYFRFLPNEDPQVIWITGIQVQMVEENGETPASQEFMCHVNLDLDIEQHRRFFGWEKLASRRVFTLSQGQYEVHFPAGFGFPVYTAVPFRFNTQVLNLNTPKILKKVRHRIFIDYVRDRGLKKPLNALFMKAANGLVALDDKAGYFNVDMPDQKVHGESCAVGEIVGKQMPREDRFGHKFTGHWVVKPGRNTYRTLVTSWLDLPYDTTVHYIAVHLHPFAESLELHDLTADKTVFKSRVTNSKDRIGLDHVESYDSVKGLQLYKNHQYQLVSIYNNTTSQDQDSMAVMLLYLLDKDYKKPAETTAAMKQESNFKADVAEKEIY